MKNKSNHQKNQTNAVRALALILALLMVASAAAIIITLL